MLASKSTAMRSHTDTRALHLGAQCTAKKGGSLVRHTLVDAAEHEGGGGGHAVETRSLRLQIDARALYHHSASRTAQRQKEERKLVAQTGQTKFWAPLQHGAAATVGSNGTSTEDLICAAGKIVTV